jgi:hypothetical protein
VELVDVYPRRGRVLGVEVWREEEASSGHTAKVAADEVSQGTRDWT